MTRAGKDTREPDTEAVAREAAAWFAHLRATSVTAAERAAFAEWLQCSAAHRRAYAELEVLWTDPAFDRALRLEDATFGDPRDLRSCRRLLRAPAVLLRLSLAVLILLMITPELRLRIEADFRTATGERRTVGLADGSAVTLNTNSAIAVDLGARERRVRLLRGEALFEVQPDPKHPFVVMAGHAATRVLGTRFVVRNGEEQDRVSVMSGVVEVRGPRPDAHATLRAADEITAGPRTLGTVTKVAAAHIDAWARGWLVFENTPLAEVIAEISRHRHGAIVFGDPKLEGLRVNGRFHLSDPEHILESLEQTLQIRLIRLTRWLVVIG